VGGLAGNEEPAAVTWSAGHDARDLVRSLAAVRGAAATLVREQESLSAERFAQLLSVIGDQSALALEILRRVAAESCGTGAGIEGVLARLVRVQEEGAGL
jgi:hypothetical protein